MMKRFTLPRRSTCRSGFTLVEVVVSLAIMTFAVLTIVALLSTSLISFRKSADVTLTGLMLQETFSEIQQEPFSSLGTTPFVAYFDQDGFLVGSSSSASVPAAGTYVYAVYASQPTTNPSSVSSGQLVSYQAQIFKNVTIPSTGPVPTGATPIKSYSFAVANQGT